MTNDDAIALGLALLEAARADALPVVVDVRRGDQVHLGFRVQGKVPALNPTG